MSVTPPVSSPGVYVQEVPSGVRTITGVATSITAFIDYFKKGLLDEPVQLLSMADLERELGGLDAQSEASYAIQQFFLNGGTEAWAIRVAKGATAADVQILDGIRGALALIVQAGRMDSINPGEWGNHLRVNVDYPSPPATNQFNITILLFEDKNGEEVLVRSEVFRGVSIDNTAPNFVETVLNDEFTGSKLVQLTANQKNPNYPKDRPCQTGTVSGGPPPAALTEKNHPELQITIGNSGPYPAKLLNLPPAPTPSDFRKILETAIRAANPGETRFSQATVSIVEGNLRILLGPGASPSDIVAFAGTIADAGKGTLGDATTVTDLKLDKASAIWNVQSYSLGHGPALASTAQGDGTLGANGTLPDGLSLIGDPATKKGIYALDKVDLFNILCIPRTAMITPTSAADAVIAVANTYCEKRRAFFIIDTPSGYRDPQLFKDWVDTDATLRDKNAAIYFPRVQIPDPLNGLRLRSVGASGTIAGLFARTDVNRGVWKAPAGTEATLTNVQQLDYSLNDSENGILNPLAINCLRNFPIYGNICWGARTLDGSDQAASEWKYIQVRRTALFIEETLFRGLKWVVFESNAEPLWAQIRLNVGAFMRGLFRQGAFQGTTPREAYFVKCDAETTTQDDINHGMVNILVGFAPLKPAEFVIIRIQQMAGQIQT